MWRLRADIAAVAALPDHVLVLGPSGSGKEPVAQAIHRRSACGSREMVSRSAVTIPEGIADAELFGNVKNYPQAGMIERLGLVGASHDTTLYLDEFGEMPSHVQLRPAPKANRVAFYLARAYEDASFYLPFSAVSRSGQRPEKSKFVYDA